MSHIHLIFGWGIGDGCIMKIVTSSGMINCRTARIIRVKQNAIVQFSTCSQNYYFKANSSHCLEYWRQKAVAAQLIQQSLITSTLNVV